MILDTVLLVPENDVESQTILEIATKVGIPILKSEQPHGARLANEPNLLARLDHSTNQVANHSTNPVDIHRRLAIVEIPGPLLEESLRQAGWEVIIIDHHRYDELDRRNPLSSLEQFLVIFQITPADLDNLGFDPRIIFGLGVMDRGFVWGLSPAGFSISESAQVRVEYRRRKNLLKGENAILIQSVKRAWETREQQDGVYIIRSDNKEHHIREEISFLLAESHELPPPAIIYEGDGRVTVQDCAQAPLLFTHFGGYTFGNDLCWGREANSHPTLTPEQLLVLINA